MDSTAPPPAPTLRIRNCTKWDLRCKFKLLSLQPSFLPAGDEISVSNKWWRWYTVRVCRVWEKNRYSCHWFARPHETYYAYYSDEKKLSILTEQQAIELGPNEDNSGLEFWLGHNWKIEEKELGVEWRFMESFKNASQEDKKTFEYTTQEGFHPNKAPGAVFLDKSSNGHGRKLWIKEIQVVMVLNTNHNTKKQHLQSVPVLSRERSKCTMTLSPDESIAIWQAVVNIFGNPFRLNYFAYKGLDSAFWPTLPVFEKAIVKYMCVAEGATRKKEE